MRAHDLLKTLGIDTPVIGAPMAGGASTPELAAAVSNAGGLGSLAGSYLSPEQMITMIARTRELTKKPFAVNLFAGGYANGDRPEAEDMLRLVTGVHQDFGLPAPVLPPSVSDGFADQFEAVMEARPPVFSFTFGFPDRERLRRLRSRGMVTLGTATSYAESLFLSEYGVDAIVAQGEEAGAHRGSFTGFGADTMVPTLELVRDMNRVIPVIASGGIMDGRDVARMLANGASAVQVGTALLPCPECGAPAAHKQALLGVRSDTTVITRAFSGRPARGLLNRFIELTAGREQEILPYPWQNILTRQMRTEAAKRGEAGYLSLWAGRGVARCRSMAAADLVRRLSDALDSAVRTPVTP